TGITTHLDVQAVHPEPETSCATTVFRILQEGLTNVVRHAGASRVDVALRVRPEDLTLRIGDNGTGISEAMLSSPRSLGLIGIRERAIACGGELVIRGVPGRGTTLSLKIPLPPTAGAAT
ncbi:MAG: ATP-binding protein, partial [Chloroflexota bacterium]|nr:ATP-binding protein [Chloroflexota bacterium]